MSEPDFVLVAYNKNHFERSNFTIYKFTQDFLSKNEKRQPPVIRQEVNWHWEQLIMKIYPRNDDPMRVFLLDQVSCPLINVFWEKRIDEKSYRDRRAWQSESGFHVITRKLTAVERKEHPWDLFMTHPLHGDIIVPGVLRLPLRKIRYLDIVEKILEANAAKRLSLRVLKELWVAIVEKVYDFEHDWLKVKRFETLGIYDDMIEALRPGPNKRRPSEVEGYSDGWDSPQPTKKVKVSTGATQLIGAPSSSSFPSSTAKSNGPTKAIKVEDSAQRESGFLPAKPGPEPNQPRFVPPRSTYFSSASASMMTSERHPPTTQARSARSQQSSGTTAQNASVESAPTTVSKPEKPTKQSQSLLLSFPQIYWP